MHIKTAFLAALILCAASPAQATFEEEEVAYILFGVGKKNLNDGLEASVYISLNAAPNSLQIEPFDKRWYLYVTRRGECIYNIEHGEISRGGVRYVGQEYYVDLSNLSAVELSKPSAGRRPRVRVIGGHVGCPVNMRTVTKGCTIEHIGNARTKSADNFARSFSERFCGAIGAKKLA